MTFVAGRRARAINYASFGHITAVPVAQIRADGVEFDGVLTVEEIANAWWFFTSRDDADETARRNLAALRDADPLDAASLLVALTDYTLGEAP